MYVTLNLRTVNLCVDCNFCFTFSLCERETGVNFGTYVVSVCKYGTWLRKGTVVNQLDETNPYGSTVERLYCKRPIQCLASSKILTPHPLTARRVCTPCLWCVRGVDTLDGWRGDGGSIFWKTPDTALYSTYISTLWALQSTHY